MIFVKIGAIKFTFALPYLLTSLGDIPYRKPSSNGFKNLWVLWKLVRWNLRSHLQIYWQVWEIFLIGNRQVKAWRICEFRENWCHKIYLDLTVQIAGQLFSLFIHFLWNSGIFYTGDIHSSRSQWPRGLRRRSAAARLLRLWVRIPPGARMSVGCECCVLSGRGLCDVLITRPEESYRLWCVVVCDLETSRMRRSWPALGRSAKGKKN